MRVAWDARVLVNGDLRGMGTYAYHLLAALRRLPAGSRVAAVPR